VPSLLLGDAGDDVTVLALADHEGRLQVPVRTEVSDGREKLLMPNTQENLAPLRDMVQPGLLVFHGQTETPGIEADQEEQDIIRLPRRYGVAVFFQHAGVPFETLLFS
jgi:hypothetical protein